MTGAAPARFDLLTQPWISVRYVDGRTADVSIQTAFEDAGEIRDIVGELPTQTFAILRLLLAILYRASYDDERQGWNAREWAEWWADGIPLDLITSYLTHFQARFDLLHPERPFFQVADLRTGKDEVKDTTPLILDLPSNNRLFTNRSGTESLRLSLAEAARWLVSAQAFDPSGIKSGAVGDTRVKGGKGYPIGVAWSGHLGGIIVEGTTLHETLLLNLALPGELVIGDGRTDLPPWEDADPDTAAERQGLVPTGPVRLFTWQSRRTRLVADGDVVTGCVLANGDALTPQNQQHHEPMTAWRYSEPQTKKFGRPTYMPREHLPERAFWRGIGGLLPGAPRSQTTDGQQRYLSPAVLSFLGERVEVGDLDASYALRVRAIGVIYGSQSSVVADVVDDRLAMTVALFRGQNAPLAAAAETAVVLADEGVRALRNLAENLARAAGGDGEADRARADEAAYARLDGLYRGWLTGLGPSSDPEPAIAEWRMTAHAAIRALGAELVASAGPAAWSGRKVTGRAGTEFINTPRAESWFLRALHKTFVGAPAAEEKESAA